MTKRTRRQRQALPTYANHIELVPGLWDLTLVFCRRRADQASGQWVDEAQTAITVPWGVAKNFFFGLSACELSYERQYGAIVVPPKLVPEVPHEEIVGREGRDLLTALRDELFPIRVTTEKESEGKTGEADPPHLVTGKVRTH